LLKKSLTLGIVSWNWVSARIYCKEPPLTTRALVPKKNELLVPADLLDGSRNAATPTALEKEILRRRLPVTACHKKIRSDDRSFLREYISPPGAALQSQRAEKDN
jgi:hypothetical protein